MRGGRGGWPGGRIEGVVGTLLIVELGSLVFFGKHDGCAVGSNNSAKNHGTPTNKVSLQTKSGVGNRMVMSELTGGVNMMGLLLFKIRKIWPKALPHYVLIFLCRHREMYYYFLHLRSSCYIMPLFLLLISPSTLTLSDLYFRNTSPGQKQYSNTSPHQFVVVGFLVPLPQFILVF